MQRGFRDFIASAAGVIVILGVWVMGSHWAQAAGSGEIPEVYQNKTMPEGWWTDSEVIAEGKKIYNGKVVSAAICFACHGRDGKPVMRGVPDFRDPGVMSGKTAGQLYWRIAEGVPRTAMMAWKNKLSEKQIWKVIAYLHTYSHGGKGMAHAHP